MFFKTLFKYCNMLLKMSHWCATHRSVPRGSGWNPFKYSPTTLWLALRAYSSTIHHEASDQIEKSFRIHPLLLLSLWLEWENWPWIDLRVLKVKLAIDHGLPMKFWLCCSYERFLSARLKHGWESTNRLTMASFWRTFHHDGKFSPA